MVSRNRMRSVMDENYVDKRLSDRLSRGQTSWYYLLGSAADEKGRMKSFFNGPYPDFETATSMAERKKLSSWEVLEFGTRSLSTATQQLKHRRMAGTTAMTDVLKRQAHKQSGNEV